MAGQIQIRCYRTVRDVLSASTNKNLLNKYASVKLELGKKVFIDPLAYSAQKDPIVREVLLRGGWTEADVELKENLCRRELQWDAEEAY